MTPLKALQHKAYSFFEPPFCPIRPHFFWQPYCDRNEGLLPQGGGERVQMDLSALKKAPVFYMVLPFLPIAGMLVFDGKIEIGGRVMPEMSLGAVVILTLIISLIIEYCRNPRAKDLYEGLEVAYQEMGAAFAGVVILLIAAGVFAEGLSNIGFVDEMIALVEKSGAAKLGINPAYLILPMQQASNVGRTLSPVSGVIVAVSGAGNLSPMLLVKRTAIPTIAALAVIVLYTLIFVPLHLTTVAP